MRNNLSWNKWLLQSIFILVAANFSALEAFSVSNHYSVTRHVRPRLLVPPLYNGEDDTEDDKAFDEELNLGELKNELERSKEDAYARLFAVENKSSKPSTVHIIVFKPDTEDEGVHSIEYPAGSGRNYILAFASGSECNNFIGGLQDMEFFEPSPVELDLAALEEYCAELGIAVQCVPQDFGLMPPVARVPELTHNPDLREDKETVEQLFEMEMTKEEIQEELGDDNKDGAWE